MRRFATLCGATASSSDMTGPMNFEGMNSQLNLLKWRGKRYSGIIDGQLTDNSGVWYGLRMRDSRKLGGAVNLSPFSDEYVAE